MNETNLRKGDRMKRLRALPPEEAWTALRAMDEPQQVAVWLDLFRRTFDAARWEEARAQAERAASSFFALGLRLDEWLAARGVEVVASTSAATFGTATVRAWIDGSRVTLFEQPLDALADAFAQCGDDVPDRAMLRRAVLAHEVFHALHPACPGKIAEPAAHAFASRVSGLPCYAGLLDVVHALSKQWA